MTKVKIVSNPYEDTIAYEKLGANDAEWTPLTELASYKGRLTSSYFSTGFFPFKVREILNQIIEEFGGAEPVGVVFEGSDDEYESLQTVSALAPFTDAVQLERSSRYLSNARDVIRDVIGMFSELDPLIRESTQDKESAQADLAKISEVSSNTVPICVMGNYSSGKSTFINSLIGAEYLPSAAKPLTAKAFKITRKLQRSGASVKFTLDGSRGVVLNFDKSRFSQSGLTPGEPLLEDIEARIAACKNDTLVEHVNAAIAAVNDFERDAENQRISDIVEVSVPFSEVGLLGESENDYVIFDTPGSNSASQKDHGEVLKRALEGMSNGIPIFVSVYDQLDTDDADELSEMIKDIKGLDSRFTMIVVSKADQAGLPENGFDEVDIKNLKGQAVVKRLYSNGLYFVSSLMGMGSKNAGSFVDSGLRRHFVQQKASYSDADDEFYTQLSTYNIMPDNMKANVGIAAEYVDEPLFVNSGLFCVEHEIESFANKYAAYNKCRQMEQALEQAHERAMRDTETEVANQEKSKGYLNEKLDGDSRKLISTIKDERVQLSRIAHRDYPAHMEESISSERAHLDASKLKETENRIREELERSMDLSGEKKDVDVALGSLLRGIKRNASIALEKLDVSALSTLVSDLQRDAMRIVTEHDELNRVKDDVKSSTIDKLFDDTNKQLSDQIEHARKLLDETSRRYWTGKAEDLRDEFAHSIAGAKSLPGEVKARLEQRIVEFNPLAFRYNKVLEKDQFLLQLVDFVNMGKLARSYNQMVNDAVDCIASSLESGHALAYENWVTALEEMIVENIAELAPELRSQVEVIHGLTVAIQALRERQAKLQSLVQQVKSKIDWKDSKMVEA